MASLKPIKMWGHKRGPNPWKVVTIFNELDLPYEIEYPEDVKGASFIAVNPNGRVPAINDPNSGVTLWESGAIIDYLIETYDKDHKISFATSPEKFETKQWAAFQISGQGPYYGQAVWFSRFHPEKVPSAVERYTKEIERVISVIDLHLEKTGKQQLVGDKISYADLMFINWAAIVEMFDMGDSIFTDGKYPRYQAWLKSMKSRPSVAKMLDERAKANA